MRLYVAPTDSPFPSTWFQPFIATLVEEIEALGVEVLALDDSASEADPVLLQTPWDVQKYQHAFSRLFCHVHGSPAAPYGNWSREDHETERRMVTQCEAVFTNSQWSASALSAAYHCTNAVVTGFPMTMPPAPDVEEEGYILVPGRMDVTRTPWVLMEALAGLKKKVIFSTPNSRTDDFQRVDKGGFTRHPMMANIEVRTGIRGVALYKLLLGADVVVIGSTFDTLNLTMCEAMLWGIPVVAPDKPLFRELEVASLYTPYTTAEIRLAAMQPVKSPVEKVLDLTEPHRVARRYVERIFGALP